MPTMYTQDPQYILAVSAMDISSQRSRLRQFIIESITNCYLITVLPDAAFLTPLQAKKDLITSSTKLAELVCFEFASFSCWQLLPGSYFRFRHLPYGAKI